jgi:hypothetical protein
MSQRRPFSLIVALVASLSLPSCVQPGSATAGKLGKLQARYEDTTGITAIQTLGLLSKWYVDYQAARSLNAPDMTSAK